MTILLSAALAVLAQGPAATVPASDAPYDVGYEELLAHRDGAARAAIEACDELAADDPARLINHGVALARTGDYEAARAAFTAAADARSSVELETAGGEWVDSRHLARKGLAMLDRGEFSRYYALSLR